MLPCQSRCPRYYEGCHKTCARWSLILKVNQINQKRKKEYLSYHMERCNSVIRQFHQLMTYSHHR